MENNMANNLMVEVMKEEQGSLKDATYARALGVGKRQIYDWYAGRVLLPYSPLVKYVML